MFYCVSGDIMFIKKVEIKGSRVNIYLSDDSSFDISVNTYLNNTILIDEKINIKEIKQLKTQDEINDFKVLLIKKLSRKRLSKKECEILLMEQSLDNSVIKKLLDELESQYLINDDELKCDLINYYLISKKGINTIRQKIIERGISLNIDENLQEYINKDQYEKNIIYLIDKYKKMSKNKSKTQMKLYIKNKMLDNGYNIEDFLNYIDTDDVDELDVIHKEIEKFFKNRERNKENISKIIKKLLSKGFNYVIIKQALGSDEYETY